MGNCCCRKRSPRRRIVILLLGLDNAGKTVAVQNLTGARTESVVPTVGFSTVDLKYSSKYDVKVFDLGGSPGFRDVWQRYYVDAHGIIFVVDASDFDRLNEATTVLNSIASDSKIQGKPLLILANKQDNERALDEIDIIDKLELESLANDNECPTFITSCSATGINKLDNNIKMGYNWLIRSIISEYKQLQKRVEFDVQCQRKFDEEERNEKIQRIRLINEQEALNKELAIEQSNGTNSKNGIIIVKENKSLDLQSLSSASTTTTIESVGDDSNIIYKQLQDTENKSRPESATSLIRKQLERGNLARRSSIPIHFHKNKTTPLHVFGAKSKTVKSATVRQSTRSADTSKIFDRRNLRSAGDSIFIVSRDNHKVMPNIDGSGDLAVFTPVRGNPQPLRPFNVIKDVLPPINDIHLQKNYNATYF